MVCTGLFSPPGKSNVPSRLKQSAQGVYGLGVVRVRPAGSVELAAEAAKHSIDPIDVLQTFFGKEKVPVNAIQPDQERGPKGITIPLRRRLKRPASRELARTSLLLSESVTARARLEDAMAQRSYTLNTLKTEKDAAGKIHMREGTGPFPGKSKSPVEVRSGRSR